MRNHTKDSKKQESMEVVCSSRDIKLIWSRVNTKTELSLTIFQKLKSEMVTREEKCFIGLATACLISLIFGITSLSLTLVKDTESTTGSKATDRMRDFLQRIPNVNYNEVRSSILVEVLL